MLDPATFVTHGDQLPIETFDWGTLQWICNGSLLPGHVATVGIATAARQEQPAHYHPNCEKFYVINGHGSISSLTNGSPSSPAQLCIPIGMKHQPSTRTLPGHFHRLPRPIGKRFFWTRPNRGTAEFCRFRDIFFLLLLATRQTDRFRFFIRISLILWKSFPSSSFMLAFTALH